MTKMISTCLTSSSLLQDINTFSEKLKEAKFAEFNTLSTKQIEELDTVLNVDIPKLMEVSFEPVAILNFLFGFVGPKA